jgi:RecB family endonuclease NucS
VLAHPEILGDGVLVVTFEFDRWQGSGGARERDRLDVLSLGADGRLIVAELKRDRAPDTVEMQAIKYAAMASRFTEDTSSNSTLGSWPAMARWSTRTQHGNG